MKILPGYKVQVCSVTVFSPAGAWTVIKVAGVYAAGYVITQLVVTGPLEGYFDDMKWGAFPDDAIDGIEEVVYGYILPIIDLSLAAIITWSHTRGQAAEVDTSVKPVTAIEESQKVAGDAATVLPLPQNKPPTPLEQFEVQVVSETGLFGSFTNLALFLLIGLFLCFVVIILFKLTLRTRYDFILLTFLQLASSVAKENIVIKRQQYVVTIFYLFMTIFAANLVGLIPYTFTPTSSFVVTFFLALSHFNGVNLIGVLQHVWRILNLFLPSGVPVPGSPFLTIIEIISYVARVFSLSIRLFANMMSGHALLKILSGFSWSLSRAQSPLSIVALIPWTTVTAIFCLELLIAFLQAYVFIILFTIYINDALSLH